MAGYCGNYGSVKDQPSRSPGEPRSITPNRRVSTTAWGLDPITYYGTGVVAFPPGVVGERCRLRRPGTGGTIRCPMDGAPIGPYWEANTNPPDAPNKTEGGRSVLPTSRSPPWRYATKVPEASFSVPDPASAEARSQVLEIHVYQQSGSKTLGNSPAQPVPIFQCFPAQTKGEGSWEADGRTIDEVKAQLPTRAPHCSPLPNATHDSFGTLNRLYEGNRHFTAPSLYHMAQAGCNLMGLEGPPDPKQLGFPQGESLGRTWGFVSKDGRETRESYSEIRSLPSHPARLERAARLPAFAAVSDTTASPTHSDANGGHFSARHSAQGERSSFGVQRSERPRRGKALRKPLYLQRKEHVTLENNVERLQERCREQGG